MKPEILKELMLQSLEHEMGGVKIYETALKCAVNDDLKEEWEKYHEETEKHVDILRHVCVQMEYDPDEETPGRKITRDKGKALVAAMEAALAEGDEEAAQCVACESVLMAELVDHANWQLIGEAAKHLEGAEAKAVKEAYQEVEDQEDEHYYHTKGWMRELSLQSLGLKAVLPPPEEKKKVKSAMEQAKVEQSRKTR
jgi:rubrerythrin